MKKETVTRTMRPAHLQSLEREEEREKASRGKTGDGDGDGGRCGEREPCFMFLYSLARQASADWCGPGQVGSAAE
jgi:hypothetical protein